MVDWLRASRKVTGVSPLPDFHAVDEELSTAKSVAMPDSLEYLQINTILNMLGWAITQ